MGIRAMFAIAIGMFVLTSCAVSVPLQQAEPCTLRESLVIREVQAYNVGQGVSLETAIDAVISGMRIAGRDVEVRDWQATCISKGVWRVTCRMRYSNEPRIAEWHYDEEAGTISAQNILGQDFLNIVIAR